MGLSGSSLDAFDQSAWCDRHLANVNPENVQGTFIYVRWQHPLFGCAKPPHLLPKWTGRESTEDLAKMADAVTCLCLKQLGQETFPADRKVPPDDQLLAMNTTAVANLALIALNHPTQNVKTAALRDLERWRALRNPK